MWTAIAPLNVTTLILIIIIQVALQMEQDIGEIGVQEQSHSVINVLNAPFAVFRCQTDE